MSGRMTRKERIELGTEFSMENRQRIQDEATLDRGLDPYRRVPVRESARARAHTRMIERAAKFDQAAEMNERMAIESDSLGLGAEAKRLRTEAFGARAAAENLRKTDAWLERAPTRSELRRERQA